MTHRSDCEESSSPRWALGKFRRPGPTLGTRADAATTTRSNAFTRLPLPPSHLPSLLDGASLLPSRHRGAKVLVHQPREARPDNPTRSCARRPPVRLPPSFPLGETPLTHRTSKEHTPASSCDGARCRAHAAKPSSVVRLSPQAPTTTAGTRNERGRGSSGGTSPRGGNPRGGPG